MSTPTLTPEQHEVSIAFDKWWFEEGSGIRQIVGEDTEMHAHHVAKIAWLKGVCCALDRVSKTISETNQ